MAVVRFLTQSASSAFRLTARLLIDGAQSPTFQISSAPVVFRALRRVKSLRTDVTLHPSDELRSEEENPAEDRPHYLVAWSPSFAEEEEVEQEAPSARKRQTAVYKYTLGGAGEENKCTFYILIVFYGAIFGEEFPIVC